MTEGLAVQRKTKGDARPRYHFPYKSWDGKQSSKPAASVFETVLMRSVEDDNRAHLIAAVICQAANDLLNPATDTPLGFYRDARRFFLDGRMDRLADTINVEGDYVRRLLETMVPGILGGGEVQ